MIRGVLTICLLAFLIGCKNDNAPSGVLSKDEMRSVLWDMMRADQFLADYVFSRDTTLNKKSESIKLYREVFDIHHISKEQFQKSYTYYKTHPLLLKVIMDSLSNIPDETIEKLSKPKLAQDSVASSLRQYEQARMDSIRRSRVKSKFNKKTN